MDFQLLAIFILMIASAHAATQEEATSPQTYWRSILPQTPIPASILGLLPQQKETSSIDLKRDPSLFVGYNKNPSLFVGYNRNPSLFVDYNRNPSLFVGYSNRNPSLFVDYNRNPSLFVGYNNRNPSLFVGYNHKNPSLFVGYNNRNPSLFVDYKRDPSLFVGYNDRNPSLFVDYKRDPSLFVGYNNRNPSLFVDYKRDPSLFVDYKRDPSLFVGYKASAGEHEVHNDPNAPLFFLKDNLKPGLKMSLDLTNPGASPTFLSAEQAKEVPFSSSKLPEILNIFGIEPDSDDAATVQRTLEECEVLPLDGESKRCVTSLEAMLEFVQSQLGDAHVRVVETTVAGNGEEAAPTQEYVVAPQGGRQVKAEAMVSCHPEPYPSAVYYCHKTKNIEVQKVQLLSSNGVGADAVAICHTDTAAWNPKYPVFELLNVKPGTKSICHFLPPGHLIFAGLSKKDVSAR